MPLYSYVAIDKKGKSIKGQIEAPNELEASTQLARSGYMPLKIAFKGEKKEKGLGKLFKKRVRPVSRQALIVFTRQFATMVKAAVPIVEGLGILAEQTDDMSLKEALHSIVRDVEGGEKLSDALLKHPNVFSQLYVNSVVAGEAGGVLDKVLLRLADVMEEDEETRMGVKSALRYPAMVVVALIVAIIIFSVKVIPAFSQVYAGLKAELPLPTKILIGVSHFLQGPWRDSHVIWLKLLWYVILIGGVFLIFQLIRFFINTPKGRLWWDGQKFKMPVMGPLYTKMVMLRFASMLNVLYQAGLPILKILDIVKITVGNVVLAQEMEVVKKDVADGKGISGAILASRFFPRMVGYMISVGERTGALPTMLDSLCEYFSLEVKVAMKNLVSLIEPLITLVMGVVVAFLALGIFLPMWNLIQVVKHAA